MDTELPNRIIKKIVNGHKMEVRALENIKKLIQHNENKYAIESLDTIIETKKIAANLLEKLI